MKKIATPLHRLPDSYTKCSPALRMFSDPDLDSRPMARMWFPDAGAGAIPNDCIETQLRSMAEGGIGGVEVALLGDDTGNTNAKEYGRRTPNWVMTMKKVLGKCLMLSSNNK